MTRLRRALRRSGDAVLAAVLGGAAAVTVASAAPADPALAAAVAAVLGLALALRRVLPLVVVALVVGAFCVLGRLAPAFVAASPLTFVALVLALYSAGRHARGIEAWVAAAAVPAAVVVLELVGGDGTISGVFFFVCVAGLPWGAGLALRLRAQHVAVERSRTAAIEELERRAVADERARIAEELHGVVSAALADVVRHARAGRSAVGTDDEAVLRALAAIEATDTVALHDMRRLLALLRDAEPVPPSLAPAPGLDGLPDLVDAACAAGADVRLAIRGERVPTPPGVEAAAYRVVEASLAGAADRDGPVRVDVRFEAADLVVTVEGAALDDDALAGLRERVAVMGARLDLGPTRVRAELPYLLATVPG